MAESTICCGVSCAQLLFRRQRSEKVDAEEHVGHADEPQQTVTGQLLGGGCFGAVLAVEVLIDSGEGRQSHRLLLGKQGKNESDHHGGQHGLRTPAPRPRHG